MPLRGFYYGLFLLYRNGLIALLPVVFVRFPEIQVPFMATVLLSLGDPGWDLRQRMAMARVNNSWRITGDSCS